MRDRAAAPAPRADPREGTRRDPLEGLLDLRPRSPPTSTRTGSRGPRPSCPSSFEYSFDWLLAVAAQVRLRGYRVEWLVLVLVALGTLPLVSVARRPGHEPARADAVDRPARARWTSTPTGSSRSTGRSQGGHWYSDKAPGVALLAVPLVDGRSATRSTRRDSQVWNRQPGRSGRSGSGAAGWRSSRSPFSSAGSPKASSRGAGALTAVDVRASGRWPGSLGPTMFGHLPDALALFAAFVLGTRARRARDWLWVGLLAGVGVLFEYPAGLAALDPVVYAALRGGRRAALATVAGGIRRRSSSAATTGSPSARRGGSRTATRRTSSPASSSRTSSGSALPSPHGIWTLLLDGHGLLLVSPVLLAAIAGLVLFWRRSRSRRPSRRDRPRLLPLHRRVLPAERRALARAALRDGRAALPAPRAARSRSPAGGSSRSSSPPCRSASASSTSSPGRSRTGSSSSPGPRRSGRCSGLSHELGALILLACGRCGRARRARRGGDAGVSS